MSNQEEQILELNTISKATLGVSKIHGIGVIAIKNIRAGQQIYADRMPKVYSVPFSSFGKLFPEVKKIILERWPNVVNYQKFIYPDARLVSFMNHAPKGQANYDPVTDTALEDILANSEITENYCEMENAEKVFGWLNCELYENKV